jgi:hypothetical protein
MGAELIETCVNASSRQQPVTIIPIADARSPRSNPTTPMRRFSSKSGLLRQPHGTRMHRDLGRFARARFGLLVELRRWISVNNDSFKPLGIK